MDGRVYNCESSTWPSGVMFAGVDGQDLAYETDYRAIMWEILRDHMGAGVASLDAVFPSSEAPSEP